MSAAGQVVIFFDDMLDTILDGLAVVGARLARGVAVLGVATEVFGEVLTDLLAELPEALFRLDQFFVRHGVLIPCHRSNQSPIRNSR